VNRSRPYSSGPAVGEAYVWLTATGLTIGLSMILFLLGLVLIKGCEAFWPRRVVQVTLHEESADTLAGARTFGGEITKRQTKTTPTPDAAPGDSHEEWQLFVANKDVYGLGFRFVDLAQVSATEYPAGIMRLERLEYGPAIAFPVVLKLEDQPDVPADDPDFRETLDRVIGEAAKQRREIRYLEKVRIGEINRDMDRLRFRQQALERDAERGRAQPEVLQSVLARQAALQEPYEKLAEQARALRLQLQEQSLTYRLMSGQEQTIPIGQAIHFYYPNELGYFDRLALFARQVWRFLSEEPREANTEGGIFPAIFGTFVMTLLMSVAVMPFGVIAAIYLREYAGQGTFVRSVRIAVNNLAGVPSIVFGVFGLGFFIYFTGATIDQLLFPDRLPTPTFGTGGILWASLTLALMTVPVVIVASEEALAAVSRGAREGSLACGASKWQTIRRIVLPAAAPGILTGLILAMARGAGEVAPLMLVGVVKLAPDLPLSLNYPFLHLDQKFMHLGFHIYDLGFQSPDSEAAKPMVFATTLLLIGLVVVLNLGAIIIRERLRRKYGTGAF
jgi:phosphate transport system permease protein